jgi:hypothetical protein
MSIRPTNEPLIGVASDPPRREGLAVPARYPLLLEINARVWLRNLSRTAGKPMTLAEIDDATLDEVAGGGFDWIWLMGVWRTGAASRAVSRSRPAWQAEFRAVLADLAEDDICGSAFAISGYEVSDTLGGRAALAQLRARLARRGLRLMLDFVPNHTALDHPWAVARPDFFVQGSAQSLAAMPENYCQVETAEGPRILAHGRDPNFPSWADTLQLDYANPALQAACVEQLTSIARQCDGLRCDMAMLQLPQVFERTWHRTSAPFWPTAIARVRDAQPGFVFLAEAYWDLEWELQQQGFDWCYDKRLYDRVRDGQAGPVRAHLGASLDYQDGLARFLENHDEARVAATLAWPRHQAAALVTYLAPGLRFFHHGQLEGARIRLPVHLCRAPLEPKVSEIVAFYAELITQLTAGAVFREGAWSLIPPEPAWPGNATSDSVIAYAWRAETDGCRVVVVNYSPERAQCRLRLPFPELLGHRLRLGREMATAVFACHGDDAPGQELFVDLGGWGYAVVRLDRLDT